MWNSTELHLIYTKKGGSDWNISRFIFLFSVQKKCRHIVLFDINNIFIFDFNQICQLKSGFFNKQNDYWCCNIKSFLLQVSLGVLVQKRQLINHLYEYME